MSGRRRGRRPGGGDTRGAILAAAREEFGERGYDRATLRAIGAAAGVDPALIVHFFASKEGLLAESLRLPADPAAVVGDVLASAPPERAGEELVRRVLTVWQQPDVAGQVRSLLRTAVSHEHAMDVLRAMLLDTVIAAVSTLVADDTAQQRAELVATMIAGLALTRLVLRLPVVAEMDVDDLARAVGPAVQHFLTDAW